MAQIPSIPKRNDLFEYTARIVTIRYQHRMADTLRTYWGIPALFSPVNSPYLPHYPTSQRHLSASTIVGGCLGLLRGQLISIHTDFQGLGRLSSISYLERDNGPTAEYRWTMTVKSEKTFIDS